MDPNISTCSIERSYSFLIKIGIKCIFTLLISACQTTEVSRNSGVVIKSKGETCYILTPENLLSQTSVCKDIDNKKIRFTIGSKIFTYDSQKYEENILDRMIQYLRLTHYPLDDLKGSSLELWYSCHWLNVEKCHTTVFVKSNAGNFAMRYPISPHEWRFAPEKILWLGRQSYPAMAPLQLGYLEIQAKPGYNAQTLTRFIEETGILSARNKKQQLVITNFLGHWPKKILVMDPFSELKIAKHMKAHIHADMLLENVSFLPGVDEDGPKAKYSSTKFTESSLIHLLNGP